MNEARDPRAAPQRCDVVVPVKHLDRAKTRLAEVGDLLRRDLVLAFLLDTVEAVAGSARTARIVVVTDDPVVSHRVAHGWGEVVRVVAEPDPSGINGALHRGVAALGDADTGVLALCADLPALTSEAVTQLIASAPEGRPGFVADRIGTGTTAYVAADRAQFDPRFGAGSRAAHAALGAEDLTVRVPPLLRCDVDTRADLVLLGDALGPHTREVLARNGSGPLLT